MIVESVHTIDTNILIYAIDRDAGPKRDAAQEILVQAAQRNGLLVLQVLGEFFHATTRKGLLPNAKAALYIDDWRAVFPVISASESALTDAIAAVGHHRLSFWDAMLWATAKQAGCSVIISEDMQHGRNFGGVEIVNPFAA